MTAVSQNLTYGIAAAPIIPLPETNSADAVGVATDAFFLQIMDQNDLGLHNVDAPQTILPTCGVACASTTVPIPSDLAEDQPVADAAGLLPLAQNFFAAPLLLVATQAPAASDVVQTNAAWPASEKAPVAAKAALSAPLSLGGAADTVVLPFSVVNAQVVGRDGLGASQSPASSPGLPQAISPAFDMKPADPAMVAVSKQVVVAPIPDKATAETAAQILPRGEGRPLPLLAKTHETPDHPSETKSALPANQPVHRLDKSLGDQGLYTAPVLHTAPVLRGDSTESSTKQGDYPQHSNAVHTSAESAWRQKWIGGPSEGNLPVLPGERLPAVLQGVAGFASIASSQTATIAAIGPSASDTALPPLSAALALTPSDASHTAPPAMTAEKPSQPAAITAFSDVDVLPPDLPSNSEGSSILSLDPALRIASKDQQISASAPTTAAALAPVIVELARSGNDGPIDLALAPEELGRLTISIRQEGDFVHVSMTAERPETLDLLRRHASDLLADLRQSGFSGASFSFGQGAQDQVPQFARGTFDAEGAVPAQPETPDFKNSPINRAHTGASLDLRF